ncbi:MAG: hypothetical protein R6X10_07760 [Desulfobacterales bacterium]
MKQITFLKVMLPEYPFPAGPGRLSGLKCLFSFLQKKGFFRILPA